MFHAYFFVVKKLAMMLIPFYREGLISQVLGVLAEDSLQVPLESAEDVLGGSLQYCWFSEGI